jgi:hypothetical protein
MFDRLWQLFHTSTLTYDEHSLIRYDNVDPRAFDMSQWFNVVGTLGYLCWVGAYFLMIRKSHRDRAYGLPLLAICLNFSWEFLGSFVFYDPIKLWVYTNRAWLAFDLVVFGQLLYFGRELQTIPEIRKHYLKVVALTLVLAATGEYLFVECYHDRLGLMTAFIINAIMSVLFVSLYFSRREHLRGLSLGAAWLKLLGSFGPAIQCQILIRMLDNRLPQISFLTFLSVLILVADVLYIGLLSNALRQRALQSRANDAVLVAS